MSLYAHHLVISGFLQHRGHLAGCDRVVAMLDSQREPGTRVDYREWNSDWRAEAAFIARHRPKGKHATPPRVCLYAYSWGVGWGAQRLAWELCELQIPVFGLISCDGVYRHSYRFGNWRAFIPGSIIRLPNTVQRVMAFHQANNLPAGHRLFKGNTEIKRRRLDRVQLNGDQFDEAATHTNIDESRQWHIACRELAEVCQHQVQADRRF